MCDAHAPQVTRPWAQRLDARTPSAQLHPAPDDASPAAPAHGRKVRKVVRDPAVRGQSRATGGRWPGARWQRALVALGATFTRAPGPQAVSCHSPSRRIGTAPPPGVHAVDLHLGRSDHEVGVDLRLVDAGSLLLLGRHALERPCRGRRRTRCARRRSRRTACCGTRARCRRRATTQSTSASSPRRRAPSSRSSSARTRSSPPTAGTSTISPPAKRSSRPSTIPPLRANGIVARTVPSARIGAGS